MTTIGIIGKICAGKSTIAKEISERFRIPIISFGSFLIDYSKKNNLPTDRNSLQNLGNHFIQQDAGRFLKNVISTQSEIKGLMIIEGIRHLSIYNEIERISEKCIFIFIDTSIEIRYVRYCDRLKESDKKVDLSEFYVIDNHNVEKEIDSLKDKCQFIIKTNVRDDVQNLFENLNTFLADRRSNES